MLTYAGYNSIGVESMKGHGKDGEFNINKIRLGDNGKKKKGCRAMSLVYPMDPVLPTSLEPGKTYKELTIGKTRPQNVESGGTGLGRNRISSDLNWRDKRNFILASSWDGYTYGGDGLILVNPDYKDNFRLEEYGIGSDGRNISDGAYETALFYFEGGKGEFAIVRSGEYGVDIYSVDGENMDKKEADIQAVAGWISGASEEARIDTLKKRKEILKENIRSIEYELASYESEDKALPDNIL